MSLLEELSSSSTGAYAIATAAITISILLSGFAIGIGKALGNRRIAGFGKEELGQAVISAALFGAIVVLASTTEAAASSLVPSFSASSLCPLLQHPTNSPAFYAQCNYASLASSSESLTSSSFKSQNILGFLSNLGLDFGVVSAQPFSGLKYSADALNSLVSQLVLLLSLVNAQVSFLGFAIAAAFPIFLPAGLILRMFFATRRLGGAAIALAVSFYIIYPLAFLVAFPALQGEAQAASSALADFNAFNSKYSSVPMMDLQKQDVIAQKISELSQGDLPGEAAALARSLSLALSSIFMFAVVLPLLALAVSLAGALALYRSLGAEISLGKFEII